MFRSWNFRTVRYEMLRVDLKETPGCCRCFPRSKVSLMSAFDAILALIIVSTVSTHSECFSTLDYVYQSSHW